MTEQGYYIIFLVLFLITGVCVGSFMNVVIYRLPRIIFGADEHDDKRFSLAWPPSHCPRCQSRIRFYDNIPVVSWLILRGKCRCCLTRISALYPLTEVIIGLWFVIVYLLVISVNTFLTFSNMLDLLPPIVLFCLLYCITVIDFRYFLIPDILSFGLMWSGLLFSVCGVINISPFQAIFSCVLTYCLISIVKQGYRVIRKYDGLGSGDAKLFAAATVWLGLNQISWLILFSAICGGVLYGIQLFYRRTFSVILFNSLLEQNDDNNIQTDGIYIPFGPAIAITTLTLYLAHI
ncbi:MULTISPECIES: prepilin peptidase [unclassified Providencia]|uniref:prepilin peptidase n=1 Tax=unclassified Providencia TaxID=2633465 RepID=UPI00234B0AAD|nr:MULTISPECIES: A24 family peptidase [unclassified Providencia]